jgi:hypothetical protein
VLPKNAADDACITLAGRQQQKLTAATAMHGPKQQAKFALYVEGAKLPFDANGTFT